jgi:hypothetical protein
LTAGLDQSAGAGPALGVFALGFLFGEAGFLLFMGADVLGERAGPWIIPPDIVCLASQARAGVFRQRGDDQ